LDPDPNQRLNYASRKLQEAGDDKSGRRNPAFIKATPSKNPAIAKALNAVACALAWHALLMHFFREAQNISGDCTDPAAFPRRKTSVLIMEL
jgi:hypothetical protein